MRNGLRTIIAAGYCLRASLRFVTPSPSKALLNKPALCTEIGFSVSDEGAMTSARDARHHPSALRNREFISTELLKLVTQEHGAMLEIASGTGCHAEAFAKVLPPGWIFQPTEYDETLIPDIVATIEGGQYRNIRLPVVLDVCSDPSTWPRPGGAAGTGDGDEDDARLWDSVICSNMIHISPQECTRGLLSGASEGLKMGGLLILYGPFALDGVLTPDSNKSFDTSLKARSGGRWGIRDAAWVADLALQRGLELTAMELMPANNFFVVFKKVRLSAASATSDASPAGGGDAHKARVAGLVSAVVIPAREALEAKLAAE